MTITHIGLDARRIGGRTGAEIAGDVPVGVDGRRSSVIEGDDATHYTPKGT
jgi:hypothetical protein